MPSIRRHNAAGPAGLTLLECVVAMLILSFVTVGLLYTSSAGHQHLQYAGTELRAVRLAEHLLEEIQSRPYEGTSGAGRSTWHVDDYDGFAEQPGTLSDFAGALYDPEDQVFERAVSITPSTVTLSKLGIVVQGKTAEITLKADDHAWTMWRFIPEPSAP